MTESTTLTDDARRLSELRAAEEEAKAIYDEAKGERERAEAALIERMQDEGCEGVKADGLNYIPASTTYAQVQDRSEFIEWAEVHEPELLETKERKKLLNQLVRERLDNGESLPPGLGFYPRDYISIRAK